MESEVKNPQKFENIDPKQATFQPDATRQNYGMLVWRDGTVY